MIRDDSVPARESDRKSIVSPSSEGAEWAAGARIHYSKVPGSRGGEIIALRRLWGSVPAAFRFFCKYSTNRGLSSPTDHLIIRNEPPDANIFEYFSFKTSFSLEKIPNIVF